MYVRLATFLACSAGVLIWSGIGSGGSGGTIRRAAARLRSSSGESRSSSERNAKGTEKSPDVAWRSSRRRRACRWRRSRSRGSSPRTVSYFISRRLLSFAQLILAVYAGVTAPIVGTTSLDNLKDILGTWCDWLNYAHTLIVADVRSGRERQAERRGDQVPRGAVQPAPNHRPYLRSCDPRKVGASFRVEGSRCQDARRIGYKVTKSRSLYHGSSTATKI